ncbi:MAG: PDZ domain-containing protein [Candidatus Cloacimonadota bacterium]|nr:PDZ domain-containing protein [Candidatus Cloacimonadota bacterium]
MKKVALLVLMMSFVTTMLIADEISDGDKLGQIAETIIEEVQEESDDDVSISVSINKEKNVGGTPKMGVYLRDINFQEAYEKHYDHCFGVLITGVTTGGGAHKAGLIGGDIVMEFDGQKVRFESQLSNLIKSKNIDEEVLVKYFRDGKEFTTLLVLQAPKSKGIFVDKGEYPEGKKPHKLSAGNGGGGWIPVWFQPKDKFEDINKIIEDCGFSSLGENQFFYWGLGGKGNIGKGWFLGGMGSWYSETLRNSDSLGARRMALDIGYGGVTLDKRIPIFRKLVTSFGFMLGWGGYEVEFSQMGENYDWDQLGIQLGSSENNYVQLTKEYLLFQPKMALLYRINDWLGFRAEGGYMFGLPFYEGWRSNVCEDYYEIENSPNTKFEGYTISIGPWFGF